MISLQLVVVRGVVEDSLCSHRGRVMDNKRWKSTPYQKDTS